MPGWGDVLGWVFDRLPNKKEGLRNAIKKIEREMDEIQKKASHSPRDRDRYMLLSIRLRDAQDKLKNI